MKVSTVPGPWWRQSASVAALACGSGGGERDTSCCIFVTPARKQECVSYVCTLLRWIYCWIPSFRTLLETDGEAASPPCCLGVKDRQRIRSPLHLASKTGEGEYERQKSSLGQQRDTENVLPGGQQENALVENE